MGNNETDNKLRRLIIIGEVNKYMHNKPHIAFIYKILEKKIKITKNFLAENKDILVTKADKGQVTIILADVEYKNKVENELSNTKIYEQVDGNPLNMIIKLEENLLKK